MGTLWLESDDFGARWGDVPDSASEKILDKATTLIGSPHAVTTASIQPGNGHFLIARDQVHTFWNDASEAHVDEITDVATELLGEPDTVA